MEKTILIIICMFLLTCKNEQNKTFTLKDEIKKKDSFDKFIKSHRFMYKDPAISTMFLKKNYIYTGDYRDLRNGIYTISIFTHPKPFFVAYEFTVDTINQTPIVFSNQEKLIFNDKKFYDSITDTPLIKQLIKDSIISTSERDAWLIDSNYLKFYFKRGDDKKNYIVLNKTQLQDSINKYGKSNIDFYEYMVLPNQFNYGK